MLTIALKVGTMRWELLLWSFYSNRPSCNIINHTIPTVTLGLCFGFKRSIHWFSCVLAKWRIPKSNYLLLSLHHTWLQPLLVPLSLSNPILLPSANPILPFFFPLSIVQMQLLPWILPWLAYSITISHHTLFILFGTGHLWLYSAGSLSTNICSFFSIVL